MSLHIRPLSLAGLAVLVLAGCGSGASSGTGTSDIGTSVLSTSALSSSGSTTGSTAAPPTGHGYASASAERDRLLALAKPGTALTGQGTVPGWPPANGSGIPATSREVSGFGFVADGAGNVQYLSFAVLDTAHRCAGGDLQTGGSGGHITSARPITVPTKEPCTGDEVAKLAGHR